MSGGASEERKAGRVVGVAGMRVTVRGVATLVSRVPFLLPAFFALVIVVGTIYMSAVK